MALLEGNCWLNDTLVGFFFEYLQTTEFKGNAEVLFIGPEVTQEGMNLYLTFHFIHFISNFFFLFFYVNKLLINTRNIVLSPWHFCLY